MLALVYIASASGYLACACGCVLLMRLYRRRRSINRLYRVHRSMLAGGVLTCAACGKPADHEPGRGC